MISLCVLVEFDAVCKRHFAFGWKEYAMFFESQ